MLGLDRLDYTKGIDVRLRSHSHIALFEKAIDLAKYQRVEV
jgi:trehalose-6-phosphate synthase